MLSHEETRSRAYSYVIRFCMRWHHFLCYKFSQKLPLNISNSRTFHNPVPTPERRVAPSPSIAFPTLEFLPKHVPSTNLYSL